jgi:hypothetical protein
MMGQVEQLKVRRGSIASLWSSARYFRTSPVNGRSQGRSPCLKGANGGHAGADLDQAIHERTTTGPMNALPMLS